MNMIKKVSTVNTTEAKSRKILYIVVHYTAGTDSSAGAAADVAEWFDHGPRKASADFIVDDENIIQYNPDPANRYCWSVGGAHFGSHGGSLYEIATNANTISVEICSTNNTGQMTEANDENWSAPKNVFVFGSDYESGGAGIISSLDDYAKFVKMLADGRWWMYRSW